MRAFNQRIAVRLSALILSMGWFWALNIGLAVGLIVPATMPLVQFLSSAWFQAVALPLIGVSATISGAEILGLIQETHTASMEMLRDHKAEIAALHAKHDRLHAKHDALHHKINTK